MVHLICYSFVDISSWWRDLYWVDSFVRHPDWFMFSERKVKACNVGWEKPCENHVFQQLVCYVEGKKRNLPRKKNGHYMKAVNPCHHCLPLWGAVESTFLKWEELEPWSPGGWSSFDQIQVVKSYFQILDKECVT